MDNNDKIINFPIDNEDPELFQRLVENKQIDDLQGFTENGFSYRSYIPTDDGFRHVPPIDSDLDENFELKRKHNYVSAKNIDNFEYNYFGSFLVELKDFFSIKICKRSKLEQKKRKSLKFNNSFLSGFAIIVTNNSLKLKDINDAWKKLIGNIKKGKGEDNFNNKDINICSEVIIEEVERRKRAEINLKKRQVVNQNPYINFGFNPELADAILYYDEHIPNQNNDNYKR